MKYYLIPIEEIEELEKERVNIHEMLEQTLTDKQRVFFPVASLTSKMWHITHRRWNKITWLRKK